MHVCVCTCDAFDTFDTRSQHENGVDVAPASRTEGMENLHWLLEEPWAAEGVLSYGFLKGMDDLHSFDTNPIYWLLHESIYMDGPSDQGSRWAAHRIGKGSKRGLALNPRQEVRQLSGRRREGERERERTNQRTLIPSLALT